jgi:hypothetical protein
VLVAGSRGLEFKFEAKEPIGRMAVKFGAMM